MTHSFLNSDERLRLIGILARFDFWVQNPHALLYQAGLEQFLASLNLQGAPRATATTLIQKLEGMGQLTEPPNDYALERLLTYLCQLPDLPQDDAYFCNNLISKYDLRSTAINKPQTSASKSNRLLKIFLCHASGDKEVVRTLYHRLQQDGMDPWLDEEKLLPGQDWRLEIPLAILQSDVVVVALSHNSVNAQGYIRDEISFALNVAEKLPQETIYIIPLKLEECEVPSQLTRWHWVDLYHPTGYERLFRALEYRASQVGTKSPVRESDTEEFAIDHHIDSNAPDLPELSIDKPEATLSNTLDDSDEFITPKQKRGRGSWIITLGLIALLLAVIYVTNELQRASVSIQTTTSPEDSKEDLLTVTPKPSSVSAAGIVSYTFALSPTIVTVDPSDGLGLNVRKGPRSDFEWIISLFRGEQIIITGTDSPECKWVFVTEPSSSFSGWAVSAYLRDEQGNIISEKCPPNLTKRRNSIENTTTFESKPTMEIDESIDRPIQPRESISYTISYDPPTTQSESIIEVKNNIQDLIKEPTEAIVSYTISLSPTIATVHTDGYFLNVRKGPGNTYEQIKTLFEDEQVIVTGTDTPECELVFITIPNSSFVGWVYSKYLKNSKGKLIYDDCPLISYTIALLPTNATVVEKGLSVRKGPGPNYRWADILFKDDQVVVTGTDTPECEWVFIIITKSNSSFGGWTSSKYLRDNSGELIYDNCPPTLDTQTELNERLLTRTPTTTIISDAGIISYTFALSPTIATVDLLDGYHLNVRKGPGHTYERITTLFEDKQVIVIGTDTPECEFVFITTPNSFLVGWVYSQYLKDNSGELIYDNCPPTLDTRTEPNERLPTRTPTPTIISDAGFISYTIALSPTIATVYGVGEIGLHVRKGPSLNFDSITSLQENDKIIVKGTDIPVCKWVFIAKLNSSVGGWAYSGYLQDMQGKLILEKCPPVVATQQ